MDLFEAIKKRHSYRGPFKDVGVPREDLRRIVQAGLQAPSGCNEQTTTFVIVDDPKLIGMIQKMHPVNTAMQQARAYIACIVDRVPAPVFGDMQFQIEDCSAAVENILLAVTALGYATVWIDGWLRIDHAAAKVGEIIGLPAEKVVRIILPIGVPAEALQQREKKPFEQRAWFNTYGKSQ